MRGRAGHAPEREHPRRRSEGAAWALGSRLAGHYREDSLSRDLKSAARGAGAPHSPHEGAFLSRRRNDVTLRLHFEDGAWCRGCKGAIFG